MPFQEEADQITELEELQNKKREALDCLQAMEPLSLEIFNNWLAY